MHVELDLGLCNGYGHCVIESPGFFELDDDSGKAILLRKDVTDDDRAEIDTAIMLCPVQAISLQP